MDINNAYNEDVSFYKDLLANLRAVIYTLDINTMTYTWGTGKYFDIFGYTEDEIFRNALEFANHYFHPDDKYLVKERIESFRNKNTSSWSGVYRIKHKKGHWVWIYSRLMDFKYDEHGNPTILLGIVMDATESFNTREQMIGLYKERLKDRNHSFIQKLTKREFEIIKLIASGDTYREIAKRLNIQPDTVNRHRKNILDKLDLKNIASLISFAKDTGLI